MLLTTTENISGKELEQLSLVSGECILCKNIGKDFGSAFRNLVGGEMKAYTKMLSEAKAEAIRLMEEEAGNLGADAVVAVRFSTSSIMQGAAEVLAYGTAVRFVKQ